MESKFKSMYLILSLLNQLALSLQHLLHLSYRYGLSQNSTINIQLILISAFTRLYPYHVCSRKVLLSSFLTLPLHRVYEVVPPKIND